MQLLSGEQAVGRPIDMKATSSLVVKRDSVFDIACGTPVPTSPPFEEGWCLVGTPLISAQPARDAFNDGSRTPMFDEPLLYYAEGTYHPLQYGAPMNPERGYWGLFRAGGNQNGIGIEADGIIQLEAGWNLISPVSAGEVPEHASIVGPVWRWDSVSACSERHFEAAIRLPCHSMPAACDMSLRHTIRNTAHPSFSSVASVVLLLGSTANWL